MHEQSTDSATGHAVGAEQKFDALVLRCSIRGKARVHAITDTPIMWPATWRNHIDRRPSLILCGDLIRAVRKESATAVAHHWGVSMLTVWKWADYGRHVGPFFRRLAPEKIHSETSRAKAIESSSVRNETPRSLRPDAASLAQHTSWKPCAKRTLD